MATDIISALELDKENIHSRILVVKEINNCSSSFITSCVLGHLIKKKSAVLIISTHNSIKHYQNVGLKMNYNLNRCIDDGLVQFYNFGEEYVDKLLKNEHISVEQIYQNITDKIEYMRKKYNVVNVIFDGVSHLLDMYYNIKEINLICSKIIELIREYNSLLICHFNVASEHDLTHVLANFLSHRAFMVVEVENLASGWSSDVSGHLTIKYPGKKFDNEHMHSLEIKPAQYLYKLFDRGVKLLAPGTV
ncbi:PREDICTED: uncharacterized protein LOC106119056 [Papilio xuthus]|uniref:Elongator complex protein 6 n=1 Tax=Papilio xuthus TaxID=66420 RepID=A0AAJ7EAI9_PAPXU|nr:PREDICTED: uncharacterized protein LOC106119056 [Papilio xuthus]